MHLRLSDRPPLRCPVCQWPWNSVECCQREDSSLPPAGHTRPWTQNGCGSLERFQSSLGVG